MMRQSRRRAAVLLAMFALLGAVVAHHGMPMDMHAMPAAAVCLAVLGGAVLVAAGGGLGGVSLAPRRILGWKLPDAPVFAPQSVRARAGPSCSRSVVLRR